MLRSDRTCVRSLLEAEEGLLQPWCVLFAYAAALTDQHSTLFPGYRAREAVGKDVPRSPGLSAPKKRNTYSSTDANAIGQMEPIDVDFDPPKTLGKRRRTVSSGASGVPIDGAAPTPKSQPSARPTRKSTRVTKSARKKDTTLDHFAWLGQEFHALARTCEELAEALE